MRRLKTSGDPTVSRETVTEETAKPVVFESANAPKLARVSPGLAHVVETVFYGSDEIRDTFTRLVKSLSNGDQRVEPAHLIKALDEADLRTFEARRLYATARLELESWEKKNEVVFANLRQEATAELQREKDVGARSKQITDKDVDSKCAYMFPDEWQAYELRREELKRTVDVLGGLVEDCASKVRSNQALLGKAR